MKALTIADRIPTGIVHVNDQTIGDEVVNPFGGVKETGGARLGGTIGEPRDVHDDPVGDAAQRAARLPVLSAAAGAPWTPRSRSSAPGRPGLVLAHLLHRAGIESVVLEDRDRAYVEHRVRAGVLEQGTVDLLADSGCRRACTREGLVHHGIEIRFDGRDHRIALSELTGGRSITIYGQQEVVKDLDRRPARLRRRRSCSRSPTSDSTT